MLLQIATVSAGTLSSRLLGFIRDALIATLLGIGPAADAFLFAFQLVNVARRLISEGAFNAVLVPAFLRIRQRDGAEAARRFGGRVLGAVALALIALSVIVGLAMPALVAALAPGFASTDAARLAIDAARLMLPYLALVGPVAVIMALLNADGRVAWSAFSPLLFNVLLIAVTLALLLVAPGSASIAVMLLALAVGAAGLAQALVLAFPGARMARPIRVVPDGTVLRLLGRAGPGTLAQSGPQLLIVAGAIAASLSPGSIAAIYFANRLIELPLGVVATAASTVVLTKLSDGAIRRDGQSDAALPAKAIELALSLGLAAAIGLAVLATPIVTVLFQHGAFTPDDTARTAAVLVALATGLPAHALSKIAAPIFFARENVRWPLAAMLAGLATAIVAAFALQTRYDAIGVAVAIATGAWVSALVMMGRLAARRDTRLAAGTGRRLALIVLASAAMGLVLFGCNRLIMIDPAAPFALRLSLLAALIAFGMILQIGLLSATGVLDVRLVLRGLGRKA
jgi:putative peptidoglycan lipid II flippase